MYEKDLAAIGRDNIEFGLILFQYWFQKNKDSFPRGTLATVKEVLADIDDLASLQRWS